MEWVFLVIAGGLEVFWSTCMKYSNGFTEIKYTILTVVGMIFSFLFLSQATKTLPLGTACAVWTGIGALGAVIEDARLHILCPSDLPDVHRA